MRYQILVGLIEYLMIRSFMKNLILVGLIKYIMFKSFMRLGPGRPSAGGPRMDRRAVTSPGVVKISRLASRLRRSAQRGPDHSPPAKKLRLKTVTHSLPRRCD